MRLTRVEQVEHNRTLVLEAARRVFLERGYAGATVEAIADEAGFSRGVVYSQFEGKADLFLALLEQRIAERRARYLALAADHAGLDGFRVVHRAVARDSAEARAWSLLVIEFRVAAAREPALNDRYARLHERALEGVAEIVLTVLAKDGLTTARPAREVAELLVYVELGNHLEQAAGTAALDFASVAEDVITSLVTPT
jgi:AcrR family transcriptional regulator